MSTLPGAPLSVPPRAPIPRPLTLLELATLSRVADALVPARGAVPAASSEPGFGAKLIIALDARSDAFAQITTSLAALEPVPDSELFAALRRLAEDDPVAFQALSTVVAGAWLLTDSVRARIGHDRPRVDKAGLEDAADDLTSGLLDPVLDLDPSRWIR